MSTTTTPPTPPAVEPAPPPPKARSRNSVLAAGEPAIWTSGGALAVALFMIVGLLVFLVWQGGTTFWPQPVVEVRTTDGRTYVGEIVRQEWYTPREEELIALPAGARDAARERLAAQEGKSLRRLVRTGNADVAGSQYQWVSDFQEAEGRADLWAMTIERTDSGNAYGYLDALVLVRDPKEKDIARGEVLTTNPAEAWTTFNDVHATPNLGAGPDRYFLRLRTVFGGKEQILYVPVHHVVRAYPANQLDTGDQWGIYFGRWGEFIFAEPRNANTEGGVWPAIVGTVTMTLLMTLLVVPIGVLAAVYLREYAKAGPIVSAVRIAINNLAGVPSIVYGIFGLGFFCYFVGGGVDQAFFSDKAGGEPTFGTGGVLWAALTLALLTLPVVIVSTEEALAAVPNSMREGSYACGASKWQTIYRIVLPRAMPGIMTGMILAMARGAGEVAPLMLVGAVNKASNKVLDSEFPYFHAQRSFLHLGLHIYDVGFQSPNSEASRPMVFTTTLYFGVVALLNLMAVWLRARLRRRFHVSQF